MKSGAPGWEAGDLLVELFHGLSYLIAIWVLYNNHICSL